MANRILVAFQRTQAQIEGKQLSDEKTAEVSKSLDMTADEHAHLQTVKSCVTGTLLTLDEANTVYRVLGGTVSVFNSQPLHVKAVITKLQAELLAARLGV